MAKVLCVLYPDPITGYPPKYARDDIPVLKAYPNGQTLATMFVSQGIPPTVRLPPGAHAGGSATVRAGPGERAP